MNTIGFIPCRMNSSRYPGKPLAPILGTSMIEHVYRRSAMSKKLDALYIVTCDDEIRESALVFGAKVIMTKDTHERATDRIAEALTKVEKTDKKKVGIAVMIQGDEPLIFPEMIDAAIDPVRGGKGIKVTNLMAPLKTKEEQDDPNEIKVVVDLNDFALFFSREPIPTRTRLKERVTFLKQVCIFAFKRDFLLEYTRMSPTPLEITESIDMLRILEHGKKVKMVRTPYETYSVDTPQDRSEVEKLMKKDPVYLRYKKYLL